MKDNQRALTQSMIKTYNWCPYKYYLEYIRMITIAYFHMPYTIGTAMHIGILKLLKNKKLKPALNTARTCIRKLKEAHEENYSLSVEEDQNIEFQKININGMITNYNEFYPDFIKNVEVLTTEEKLELDLKLPGRFILVSKPDAIINIDGERLLYELKSAKSLSHDSMMSYQGQVLTYFIGANIKWGMKGILFDGIKKPQLKLGKNEDIETFMGRLEEYYRTPDAFYQEPYYPTKLQLAQQLNTIKATAARIIQSEETESWPHNRFVCRVYGQCEFLPLCDYGETPTIMMKYREKTSVNEELE